MSRRAMKRYECRLCHRVGTYRPGYIEAGGDNDTWECADDLACMKRVTRKPYRRIDEVRLAELAAAGLHVSAIARELDVTASAVNTAVKRIGLAVARMPRKGPTPRGPKRLKLPRELRSRQIHLTVSPDEFEAIRQGAKRAQVSVAEYIRRACAASLANEDQAA